MKLTVPRSATDVLVRGLRLSVHLAFGALLGFGVIAVVVRREARPVTLVLAAILACVYVAGTAAERKIAVRTGYGQRPPIPTLWWAGWLAIVLLTWGALVFTDATFAYCAFPLFFILMHLIRPFPAGLAAVTGLLAWLVFAFWRTGQFGVGAVVGPAIGAAFSVVVFAIYEALVADALEQRRAFAELESTRNELAAAQHAQGVAAERERFSGEIHDTLAQGLNAIVLTARAGLAAPGPADDAPAREALVTILGLASANLAEAREIVRGSAAAAPERPDARLESEIRAAIDRVGVGDLDVTVRDERPTPAKSTPLPAPVHRLMVLAASALTANVVRHAGAGRAVLTIDSHEDGTLSMDVVDDGEGFDPALVKPGFGLTSLKDRVERLGGTLLVEAARGEGTAVNLQIPVPRDTPAARDTPAPQGTSSPQAPTTDCSEESS